MAKVAKMGRPPDPETARKKKCTLVLDSDMHRDVRLLAVREDVTISEIVERAILAWLAKPRARRPAAA
jgi:RH3 domain